MEETQTFYCEMIGCVSEIEAVDRGDPIFEDNGWKVSKQVLLCPGCYDYALWSAVTENNYERE
jgi:hypothetical protein